MLKAADFLRDRVVRRAEPGRGEPLVSVVLPTHGRRQLLRRAIETVLTQSIADLELLVMDDGSVDGSADVIAEAQSSDPRVVHVRHEHNCGLPALRVNEGIELARGRYLAFQFDDDIWRPHALEVLVAAAERQAEPTVVVGRALFRGATGEWSLPSGPLDLVTLTERNRLANNSVLVPREVVERHGLYDCHVGMRRLCDWDLWLRYIRHVPFVVVDEVVSEVFESTPGAIGLTVPWDLALFRYLHDIPRDLLLTPARWREYPVDSLRIGEVEVEKDFRRRLYEDHIVPYYLRFRHRFPEVEGFSATLPAHRSVLYTKNSYDVSNDVTLNHYDGPCSRRGTFKAHYQPLSQVGAGWSQESDALLLVRTVEEPAAKLLQDAVDKGVPIGYYLDDDLLTFHEYGPQFSYLAPGTPYHVNLSNAIRGADAVWVTNAFLERSVAPLNPRVIPHNNAVPAEALPPSVRTRQPGRPLRVGYVGSGYRIEEFRKIWHALEEVSREHGDALCFEFWGIDVSSLPPLSSPIVQRPFTFSYPAYLRRLRHAEFDVLLTPLLDHPRPRLAKSLIKYYECAVAGALGIFSDVPQYAALPAGLTCLKAENTADAWAAALKTAIGMAPLAFDGMRARALEHVREEFTEVAQVHRHEAAWRATEFHGRTRGARHEDGRPRVVYALHSAHFGGGELQLWRRLRLARRYGIEPVVVMPRVLQRTEAALEVARNLEVEGIRAEFVDYTCFDRPRSPREFKSDLESDQVRQLLERIRPAVVHTVTFIPTFGQVCRELGIPHVASLYAVEDEFEWAEGAPDFVHAEMVQSDSFRYAKRWSGLLGVEKLLAREVVPEEVFEVGRRRRLAATAGTGAAFPLRLVAMGTLQERKRQLETIEAAGRLGREGFEFTLELHGYTHFFPAYFARCEERIREHGLEGRVRFLGFSTDVGAVLETADAVLSLSTYESFPSAIKEAMAAGVLVVATPVGGIPELIIDGVTGVLCADTSVEAIVDGTRRALSLAPGDRERIVAQARRVARSEFHPDRAINDLLTLYNRALEKSVESRPPVKAAPRLPAAASPGSGERVVSPPRPPASHVLISGPVSFDVTPEDSDWTGLDVMVGTHGRSPAGSLRLQVRTAGDLPLREATATLANAQDHGWLTFRFAPVANSAERGFRLRFELESAGGDTRLSLFQASDAEARPLRALRRVGIPLPGGQLYCRLRYARSSTTAQRSYP